MAFFDFWKSKPDTQPTENTDNLDNLRMDSISHPLLSVNNSKDKLSQFTPQEAAQAGPDYARHWMKGLGVLGKVINAPAEDATKNGFKIITGDPKKDRIIQNRLYELDLQNKLTECLRYMRLHSNGSVLYYVLESNKPQNSEILKEPIPSQINKIASINVVEPDNFTATFLQDNPLSSKYNTPEFRIFGEEIHPSRFNWFVKDFNRTLKTGKSVLEDVFDAVKANEIGLWSVSHVLMELSLKIFKSPAIKNGNRAQTAAFAGRMRDVLSTNSVIAIDSTEEFDKKTANLSGIKEIFDWIMENISMLSEIPQSRLKGAAHGVIASGDYDLIAYYDKVERSQKNILYKPINDVVQLVILEQKLNITDWEIIFNPLWKLSPMDEAEIELKRANRDKIDIESGKLSPMEARQLDPRLSLLEDLPTGEGVDNDPELIPDQE